MSQGRGHPPLRPGETMGDAPLAQASPFIDRILALPPLTLSSSSLEALVGQIPT